MWNKCKAAIETKLATEATGTKGRLARWAIDTGVQAARFTLAGQPVPPSLALRRNIADRLVLALVDARLEPTDARSPLSLSLQLELFEKNALRAALRRTGGNVALAAEQLGIGKTTLYDKLKRFEIAI